MLTQSRSHSMNFQNLILVLSLIVASSSFGQSQKDLTVSDGTQSVYELRIYYPHEGKMSDILERFREHTTGLFQKHGFTNVGYWVTKPTDSASFADRIIATNKGKEALLYLVSFPNMEARNKAWNDFVKDPEWIKVYEESRKAGPLVREIEQIYLNPTDFSTLK